MEALREDQTLVILYWVILNMLISTKAIMPYMSYHQK